MVWSRDSKRLYSIRRTDNRVVQVITIDVGTGAVRLVSTLGADFYFAARDPDDNARERPPRGCLIRRGGATRSAHERRDDVLRREARRDLLQQAFQPGRVDGRLALAAVRLRHFVQHFLANRARRIQERR